MNHLWPSPARRVWSPPCSRNCVPELRECGGENEFMIEERNHDVEVREIRSGTPGWVLPAIVLLALVATAGLVLGWRATNQLEATRQATTSELKTVRTGVD